MRIIASVLAIGLLLAPGGAAAAGSGLTKEERARFAMAVEALRGGDWRAAAAGFGTAARKGALLADYAQFFLAEALARQGDLPAARRSAEELLDRHPDSPLVPSALLLAAGLAARQEDEPGSEALIRRFLQRFAGFPDAPGARYVLGLSLEAQGRGVEAAQTFRELWLRAPASPYGEAAGERLQFLALRGVPVPSPTTVERIDRAERLLAGGVRAQAREEAEALLAELPDAELTLRGLRVLGGAWRRGGRYDVAQEAAERALADVAAARRPPLLLELARLQQRAGAREAALATLERLTREHPDAPEVADAVLQSARILEDTGRTAEAEAYYRRVVREFTDYEGGGAALWRLGWLAYLRSDLRAAALEFARLSALPAAGPYRYPAAYWAARAREVLGEEAGARHLYRLVVREAPRSYYGILAGRRSGAQVTGRGRAVPIVLPRDPLRPLAGDRRFARAEALSSLGLDAFVVGELEDILSRSLAEPARLYAVAAAFVRQERFHLALRIVRWYFGDLVSSGDPALPSAFWEMVYPLGWQRELVEAATRARVDPFLLAALVREESNFFPQARSPAGARGLMQLMPDTARPLALRRGLVFGNGELLDEPGANLELGTTYLAWLLAEFSDPRLAAAAYNAGPARVREWWAARTSDDLELFVERIPFDETRHFVKRVMVSWEEYRRIYAGSGVMAEGAGR